MSHDKHDKKHKKLQKVLHNLHIQNMNRMASGQQRERDLDAEREEERRELARQSSSRAAAKSAKGAEPVWSAKLQMIRDRNTGRERMAKERWNRFAGTESGGGRGL